MIWLTTKELYALFLESQWWIELSRTKRRSVGRCERCGSKHLLQSHHKVYRDNWFDTRFEDLEVLCRGCHEREHRIPVKIKIGKKKKHKRKKLKLLSWQPNRRRLRATPRRKWVSRGNSSN